MISRLKADLRLRDLLALWPSQNAYADIRQFESDFAGIAQQKHAVFFPYGRTAQIAILKALRLETQGKTEVICPSYTCVVVAHAIKMAGLTPVFVDVGDDYNMHPRYLHEATNEKTGAVLATSIFGHPVDLKLLGEYQDRYPDIAIIQDCAHSFFAQDTGGAYVHQQGLCAFYGLNISKIMTSIFGGMVTTDDDEFADALRSVRHTMLVKPSGFKSVKQSCYLIAAYVAFNPFIYGFVNWLDRSGLLHKFTRYYDESIIDMPADYCDWPTGVTARVGIRQCRRYMDIVTHRQKLAALYHRELHTVTGLILPPIADGATVSHFVVRSEQAERIIKACLDRGFQLGKLIDYEIPDMPPYQKDPYYGVRFSRTLPPVMINLPVHMGVKAKHAHAIVAIIKQELSV